MIVLTTFLDSMGVTLVAVAVLTAALVLFGAWGLVGGAGVLAVGCLCLSWALDRQRVRS